MLCPHVPQEIVFSRKCTAPSAFTSSNLAAETFESFHFFLMHLPHVPHEVFVVSETSAGAPWKTTLEVQAVRFEMATVGKISLSS